MIFSPEIIIAGIVFDQLPGISSLLASLLGSGAVLYYPFREIPPKLAENNNSEELVDNEE